MQAVLSYFHKGPVVFDHLMVVDKRGSFIRAFREEDSNNVLDIGFVEDNVSISNKGVIRGIHRQVEKPLGKLVQVLSGKAFDVMVDLRPFSNSYGSHEHLYLVPGISVYIPPGFGHGFQALENNTIIHYKYTQKYNPEGEYHVNPFDKQINIDWPIADHIISERDLALPYLSDMEKR